MICRPSIAQTGFALLIGTWSLHAQTPAPPVPPTKEQKEAAAAVEAPKTFAPPPLPGQLQNSAPASTPKTPEMPKAAVPPPVPPSAPASNSASKMQALEAATQAPAVKEVPRVTAPSDKLPITTSTSTSGQFVVHGKVFETRSAMSSRCEDISQELRKVLNDKEPHVLPIVVVLKTGEDAAKATGPAISTAITELTHGGFHLQVTVIDRAGLKMEDLRKEVVRALLAERILRNQTKIVTPEGRLLLPDWVMTGVLLAMDYKASARPSAMFATIFRSGKIYGIEEIISASPVTMDGLSRTIYETSCCALVLALADQPHGPQNFNKFLNSLASDPRSERELLNVAFPNFAASASSLNKWWALQLAALSKPGIAEPLTPAETFKAIGDAIQIRYEAKPDEVPENIKPRPFVLPQSLVLTMNEPKSEPPPTRSSDETTAPKAKAKDTPPTASTETAEATTDETSEEKLKRPLWRRLLFLGPADAKSDAEAQKTEEPVVVEKEEPPAEESDDKKPSFLSRLFGGGGSAEKNQDDPPEPKEEPKPADAKPVMEAKQAETQSAEPKKAEEKPVEAKKTAETKKPGPPAEEPPAEEPEAEKKPSLLNPMNWFRGGKKPAEDKAPEKPAAEAKSDEKPAKDEQAYATPAEVDFTRLIAPSLADAWQLLAPSGPRQAIGPLFRRKPKVEEEKKPESEPAEESKKAADKPKAEPKKESKPKTTNPNAKSTSKPAAASGETRTNNPNSKPVPAAMVNPGTAGTPTASKSGLVPVTLPLEEYKHILKHRDREKILNHNIATLRALELRVSVLFRPVVIGYLSAFLDLQEGKTKDMDKRIAALRQFAVVAYQKSIAVRDYLDWFEASESGRVSGKFDDYLNLPKIIEKELPPRTDPISKYLDAIDKEFSK
ncbi:MAG: hypothetical protein IAE77_12335 [Prosthecobacter sp.]|jgi:hypothetical protein|uniref:hypothetical protein n=1 Tax=Prosthecobacter sp. TaxID=1965333 RepID=UPI001A0AE709|nr:hypothetical protein [Prosthecobacter sp.]MBE2284236.1 hypothetical protein [Prosthecobacter sp.]